MAQNSRQRLRGVATLNVALFGVFAVGALAIAALKDDARGYGFASLAGGLALLACTLFTLGPTDELGRRRLTKASWVVLLIGAAVMAAGPVLMAVGGVDFSEPIGSRLRGGSMGFVAFLSWVGTATITVAAVRAAVRARSQRQREAAVEAGLDDAESEET